MGTGRLTGTNTPFDPTNPYASPPAWSRADDPQDGSDDLKNRTVTWMLFAFRGRIGRSDFWGYSLLVLCFYYASAAFLMFMISTDLEKSRTSRVVPLVSTSIVVAVAVIVVPLVLWMSAAIQVKRWHDHNLSGWWWFILLIPYIGPLVVFVKLGCLRGTVGPNTYGPDPTSR